MTIELTFPWIMLLALGAVHGVNPAMGWLFAVSLGLQEESGRAVWRALGPLALGHAAAVGATILLAGALGLVLPLAWIRWIAALTLLGFGIDQLRRHRHPRLKGMRVGNRELATWSFFMATAHGAGLMAVPFVLELTSRRQAADGIPAMHHAGHGAHVHSAHDVALGGLGSGELEGLVAALVHTSGYLVAAGLVALVVYRRFGVKLLRTAWINLNVIWAGALILTAILIPLV